MAARGPNIEKTVNLYDADWKALLSARDLVARPTCMAVKTMAMYTVADAS
jgi:hypothetical protein